MRNLSEQQWQRWEALVERLEQLPAEARDRALQEMRDQGGEDPDVVSLVALHFAHPPEPDRCRTGQHIGNFILGDQLGSGGMGVVYHAWQTTLDREVALKLIHPALIGAGQDAVVERFTQEIRTLAKFEHEGIASIYEGGIHTDQTTKETLPFFAAQLVRGGVPITDYAKAHDLTGSERLELFLRVCEAVEAAHQQSVIHRDLKPTNILVDRAGRPFVIDFGLAQVCDPSRRHRGRAFVSGTPAYMSPEQVSDAFGPMDQLSDLYALGVILYELLAGRRPYNVSPHDAWELLRQEIIAVTPPELSQYNTECRGDLESIVAKALMKRPTDRYASVAALHRVLRRYLNRVERLEIEKAIRSQEGENASAMLSTPSLPHDMMLPQRRQSEMTDRLRLLDHIFEATCASRTVRGLQAIGLRKLLLTLCGAILVIGMLWWLSPYVSLIRGHLILQQANREEDVMRAVGVYRTAVKSMRGKWFWRQQRALLFNRLGRIYAARRFGPYAMDFYQRALQENANIAVIHANKAFLLEEMAEQAAYRSGDIKPFQEVQRLYQEAVRLDAQDAFTQALQHGVPRRMQMALDRAQVDKLLTTPQGCGRREHPDAGPPAPPLTLAFYTTQRQGSFALRAGEGEVLLQHLIQALQKRGGFAVQKRAIAEDCFAVRLLARYRIERSPSHPLHKQVLQLTVIETDTGESQVEATMEWTHGELDGLTETFASQLLQQLSRAKLSHSRDGIVQGGQQS